MSESLDPAGVAVFLAAIAAVIAISSGQREQWGIRRIAMGVCAITSAAAGILLSASGWWWAGVLWSPSGVLGMVLRIASSSHNSRAC